MIPDFTDDADKMLEALSAVGLDGEPPNQAVRNYVKHQLESAYLKGSVDGMARMRQAMDEALTVAP